MVIKSRQVLNGPVFEKKNSHGYACPTKQQVPTITSDLCIAPVICIRDLLITFAGGSHPSGAFYFYLYAYSMSSPCRTGILCNIIQPVLQFQEIHDRCSLYGLPSDDIFFNVWLIKTRSKSKQNYLRINNVCVLNIKLQSATFFHILSAKNWNKERI